MPKQDLMKSICILIILMIVLIPLFILGFIWKGLDAQFSIIIGTIIGIFFATWIFIISIRAKKRTNIKLKKYPIGTIWGFNLLDWWIATIGAICGFGIILLLIGYFIIPEKINMEVLFFILFVFILSITYFIIIHILSKKVKHLNMIINGIYMVLMIILIYALKTEDIIVRLFSLLMGSLIFIGLSFWFAYSIKKKK